MKAIVLLPVAFYVLGTPAIGQTLDWFQQFHAEPSTQGVGSARLCIEPVEHVVFMVTGIDGEDWDPEGVDLPIAGGSDVLIQRFSPDGELDWTLTTGGGCAEWEYPTAMHYNYAAVTLYVAGVHHGNASLGNLSITGNCEEASMFLAAIGVGGTPLGFRTVSGVSVTPTAMLVNLDGALEVFGKNEVSPAVFRTSPFISTPPGVFRAIFIGSSLECLSAERILRTGLISSAYRNGQYQVLTGVYSEADTLWGVPLQPDAPEITGFVCKKLVNGIAWVRTIGSSTLSTTSKAAQLSGGDIVVSGYFQGDADFGSVTLEVEPEQICGFLARYTTNGDLVWAKKVFGPSYLLLGNLVGDNSNGFYLGGSFVDSLTIGNTTMPSTTDRDFFVAHVNSSGVWDGIQQMGRVHFDAGEGLAVDANGIYVAGNFDSTMVVGGQQFEPNQIGGTDLFVARFNGMEPVTSVQSMAAPGTDQLRIRANPTDGRCSIDLPSSIAVGSRIQVKIFDNLGSLVQEIPITVNEERASPITIEAEASGVYHVEVMDNGHRYTGTLVFER